MSEFVPKLGLTPSRLTQWSAIIRRSVVDRAQLRGLEMAQQHFDSEQPTSAMKYMKVPEKIELTTAPSGAVKAVSEPPNRYKPMKVPDKITLESTTSAALGPPAGVGEGGGGGGAGELGVPVVGRRPHGGVADARRKPKVAADPAPLNVQPAAQ